MNIQDKLKSSKLAKEELVLKMLIHKARSTCYTKVAEKEEITGAGVLEILQDGFALRAMEINYFLA